LWVGQADQLLPDLSTDDVIRSSTDTVHSKVSPATKIRNIYYWRFKVPRLHKERIRAWASVLEHASNLTQRPIIVHVNSEQQGRKILPNAALLAANTVQTGHDESSRNQLWQLPLNYLDQHPDDQFINLEPWYEGIRDSFHTEDQLYAYWVSMLAGCSSFCYGAQGIWNVGDGEFMSHWGRQTFATAWQLEGPALLGESHAFFMEHWRPETGKPFVEEENERLISIARQHRNRQISYFPAVEDNENKPGDGIIWLPLEGIKTDKLPENGPVVVISEIG